MFEFLGLVGAFCAAGIVKIFYAYPINSAQDAAAWVQAVGSIGAIVASAVIVGYQQAQSRRRDEEIRNEAQLNLLHAAVLCAKDAVGVLKEIEDDFGRGLTVPTAKIRSAIVRLGHVLTGIDRVPQWNMASEDARFLGRLRFEVGNAQSRIDAITDHQSHQANNYSPSIASAIQDAEKIRKELNLKYRGLTGIDLTSD